MVLIILGIIVLVLGIFILKQKEELQKLGNGIRSVGIANPKQCKNTGAW